jgi:hypothetical protein
MPSLDEIIAPGAVGNVNNVSAPAANTAASVYWGGANGVSWLLHRIDYSYSGSGTPANGKITISDGANVVRQWDYNATAHDFAAFFPPLECANGNTLTVTLAAGGANTSATVSGHASPRPVVTSWSLDYSSMGNSMYGEEP